MGKGYTTARATFIDDKMFELPMDLMFKTITQTDKNIDTQIEKVNAFNDLLKTENLKTDDPAVNKILKEYKGRMATVTDGILKAPLDYRKFNKDIAYISRDLETELDTGTLGRAQEQSKVYDEWRKELKNLKDVDGDLLDLANRDALTSYEKAGGLSYKSPDDYNTISKYTKTPLARVDVDKLINTVGTNFQGDKTATAYATNSKVGYLQTGSGTVLERKVAEVESVMSTSLNESGWEEQKRQEYQMKQNVGELGEDVDIESRIATEKKAIIEAAKTKLGYREETKSASISADGVYLANQARQERAQAGGEIVTLERDTRNYKTADGGIKWSKDQINKFDGYVDASGKTVPGMKDTMEVLGRQIGINDIKTFVDAYARPGRLDELEPQLTALGTTVDELKEYISYQMDVQQQHTPIKPGLTVDQINNDAGAFNEQQKHLKTIVQGVNSWSPNDKVLGITVSENGVYKETEFKTVADFLKNTKDYVYIPVTGEAINSVIKKDDKGFPIGKDNFTFMNSETNQPMSIKEMVAAGREKELQTDTEKLSTYDSGESVLKATTGNLKEYQEFEYKNGRVIDEKVYNLNVNSFRIDTKTGERVYTTVDVKYPASKIKTN